MKGNRKVYHWTQFVQASYSGICVLCGDKGEQGLDLCRACRADFSENEGACRRCARPLPKAAGPICGRCLHAPPSFDEAIAAYRYEQPLARLIIELKFQGQLYLARTLGELLASALIPRTGPTDVIVPVPLHPSRLRERGYNQALELVRPLVGRLGRPICSNGVQRIRATQSQADLSARQRFRNVRGSFRALERFDGLTVAVADDVLTTGATAEEMARCLKCAGARKVIVWSLARALGPSR